jgi:predicted ArsR family transcriptional regulator
VAEAARSGLQELARLQAAVAAGAALTQWTDQRGRLPEALDFVLREPAVTTKGLARHLRLTPQAALRLLTALARGGVVRETTGRRSFRAFAI